MTHANHQTHKQTNEVNKNDQNILLNRKEHIRCSILFQLSYQIEENVQIRNVIPEIQQQSFPPFWPQQSKQLTVCHPASPCNISTLSQAVK